MLWHAEQRRSHLYPKSEESKLREQYEPTTILQDFAGAITWEVQANLGVSLTESYIVRWST